MTAKNGVAPTKRLGEADRPRWQRQAIQDALEVGGVDEEDVGGEDVPLEHGDVDGVFEAEVEEDADDEERVAEFFDPDGGA